MLLRSCFLCSHHRMKGEEGAKHSFCEKENCWARYSRCVARKAIERFLEQDRLEVVREFSALSHVYGRE
ncbi:MAG: hypothetical protein WHX93_02955 [bacterium]